MKYLFIRFHILFILLFKVICLIECTYIVYISTILLGYIANELCKDHFVNVV